MQDFFEAALPWIAMGFVVAISLTYFNSKKNKETKEK